MTYNVGHVCRMAALELRYQILERAALLADADPAELELTEEGVTSVDAGELVLTLAEIAERSRVAERGPLSGRASFLAEFPPCEDGVCGGLTYPAFLAPSFSAQAAAVRVDRATGRVTVDRVAAAMDVGRAINPLAVEGQLEGGVAMGLGYGLMEEIKMEGGRVLNPDFLDYKIPTAVDMPTVVPIIVERPSEAGPHGAKGVGEPPASLPGAALANAVHDAVGVRLLKLPMTRKPSSRR